ncbi:hypothetical protein A4G18_00540 [Pasteurellaceae bacterium Pebbles2]|nr:hypothetical protein [Pasteurellaceae bacterium Pebbles2]
MTEKPLCCPKCGAELMDFYFGDDGNVGEWDDDRFSCIGYPLSEKKYDILTWGHPFNRTKSCGDFGLEDLGVEYCEDE